MAVTIGIKKLRQGYAFVDAAVTVIVDQIASFCGAWMYIRTAVIAVLPSDHHTTSSYVKTGRIDMAVSVSILGAIRGRVAILITAIGVADFDGAGKAGGIAVIAIVPAASDADMPIAICICSASTEVIGATLISHAAVH